MNAVFQLLLLLTTVRSTCTSTVRSTCTSHPIIVCENGIQNVKSAVNTIGYSVSSVTEECKNVFPSSFRTVNETEPGRFDLRVEKSGGNFTLSWLCEHLKATEYSNLQYIVQFYIEESNVVPYLFKCCQSLHVFITSEAKQCRLRQSCRYIGDIGVIKINAIVVSIADQWYTQLQFVSPGPITQLTTTTSIRLYNTSIITFPEDNFTIVIPTDDEKAQTNITTGIAVGGSVAAATFIGVIVYTKLAKKKLCYKSTPMTDSKMTQSNSTNAAFEEQNYRKYSTMHQSNSTPTLDDELDVFDSCHVANKVEQMAKKNKMADRLPSFMQRAIININREESFETNTSIEFCPPTEGSCQSNHELYI